MKTRKEILADIEEGLKSGILIEDDLKPFIKSVPAPTAAVQATTTAATRRDDDEHDKLSAVDVMFYIAGLVLYSAIVSYIVQSWELGNAALHIAMSAGVGLGLWALAYYLIKSPHQNDIRKGLINALLLTGSLCVVTGGYVITNEIIGGFDELNLLPGAIMLALIGGAHLLFDKFVKRDLVLLMGIFMCVAAFPSLLWGFLQDTELPGEVWAAVLVFTAGLLAYSTRVTAKIKPDRAKLRDSFDAFAAFLALGTMYVYSFFDYALIWYILLVGGVFGIFYLSIITQSKHLLGNASFFLVLTVITICFRYFNDFGVTTSLVLATIGLLGSAAVAAMINKTYFKAPPKQ